MLRVILRISAFFVVGVLILVGGISQKATAQEPRSEAQQPVLEDPSTLAPTPKSLTVSFSGAWTAGPSEAVTVQNNLAYVGSGANLEIVDISDPAHPKKQGSLRLSLPPEDITVAGDYAYVVNGVYGLRVIDVSDPAAPQEVGSYYTGNQLTGDSGAEAHGVSVVGDYAYVASRYRFWIFDISDPTNPQHVGEFDTNTRLNDVVVSGNYAYLADDPGVVLRVLDISDPTSPQQVETFDMGDRAVSVAVEGNYAYLAANDEAGSSSGSDAVYGMRVIDVSDPTAVQQVGTYTFVEEGNVKGHSITVAGDRAYLATSNSTILGNQKGMVVLDVTDPTLPSKAGAYVTGDATMDVAVDGNYAYLADRGEGMPVIDVSDLTNLRKESTYPGTAGEAQNVVTNGNYTYVAEGQAGLQVLDVSDPENPQKTGAFAADTIYADEITMVGDYPYVADSENGGVWVIDVSDPANPQKVTRVPPLYDHLPSDYPTVYAPVEDIVVEGDYAYAILNAPLSGSSIIRSGLQVLDVSDPTNPQQVTFLSEDTIFPEGDTGIEEVAVQGDYAYLSLEALSQTGSAPLLQVFDVSDPKNPQKVVASGFTTSTADIAVAGDYAYLLEHQLQVFDISDPADPQQVGSFDIDASDVDVAGNYVYTAAGSEGLQVLDVSDPANPQEAGSFDNSAGYAHDNNFAYAQGVTTVNGVTYLAYGEDGLYVLEQTIEQPSTISANITRTFDGATDSTGYRLVALPGAVDRSLSDVLPGEAGAEWMAYRDDGSEESYLQKYDGSSAFTFQPGTGFWVTATEEWSFSEEIETVELSGGASGGGSSASGSVATVELRAGWNVISNPLGTDVAWSAVEAATGADLQPLWAFGGSFDSTATFASARSGAAYYFYNDAGLEELLIPYAGAGTNGPTGTAVAKEGAVSKEEAPMLSLRAEAAETDHSASTVRVGVGAEAEAVVAPPGQFEALSLRIEAKSESEGRSSLLMAERRPLEGQGETFPLRLTSRVEGPISLSAENLEAIEGKEAALLNPSTGETYDLRAQETVTVDPTGESTKEGESATFKLAVGSAGYVEGQKQEVLPTEVSLTSYPNPAREQGTLEFALPEETEVALKVYDVLGREVATLAEGRKEAGRHTVRLEVSRLSSGVYFGRLQAEGQTLTQKITVVR